MLSSDENNKSMMEASEEAIELLERMLSRLHSIQNFEQLMQQWFEDD